MEVQNTPNLYLLSLCFDQPRQTVTQIALTVLCHRNGEVMRPVFAKIKIEAALAIAN